MRNYISSIFITALTLLLATGCGKKEGSKEEADMGHIIAANPSSDDKKTDKKQIPVKTVLSKTKYGRKDPFSPVFEYSYQKSTSDLTLQGIVFAGKKSHAIINGEIVTAGERIGENTLVEIRENSVILNDGVEDFEMRLMRKK